MKSVWQQVYRQHARAIRLELGSDRLKHDPRIPYLNFYAKVEDGKFWHSLRMDYQMGHLQRMAMLRTMGVEILSGWDFWEWEELYWKI